VEASEFSQAQVGGDGYPQRVFFLGNALARVEGEAEEVSCIGGGGRAQRIFGSGQVFILPIEVDVAGVPGVAGEPSQDSRSTFEDPTAWRPGQ